MVMHCLTFPHVADTVHATSDCCARCCSYSSGGAVANRAVEPGPAVPVEPGEYRHSRLRAGGEVLAVDLSGSLAGVRNVSQRGRKSCLSTSACRYLGSHSSVGDVGMMSCHGGAACRHGRAADVDGRRGGSSSGFTGRRVSGVLAGGAAVFAEHGPVLCDLTGPLVGVPDYGGGGLGRGEPGDVRPVPGLVADRESRPG